MQYQNKLFVTAAKDPSVFSRPLLPSYFYFEGVGSKEVLNIFSGGNHFVFKKGNNKETTGPYNYWLGVITYNSHPNILIKETSFSVLLTHPDEKVRQWAKQKLQKRT